MCHVSNDGSTWVGSECLAFCSLNINDGLKPNTLGGFLFEKELCRLLKKEKESNASLSCDFPLGMSNYIVFYVCVFCKNGWKFSDPNDCDRSLVLWVLIPMSFTAMSV